MSNTKSPFETSRALFIRRWGEMGAGWGISRTMAEIHAVLLTSDVPLGAEDLMEQLQVSRGNVSMNLRQLIAWGLIHREHKRGDRREYFVAECDIWLMFETILRERRRREVEPILETIQRCCEMLDDETATAEGPRKEHIKEYRRRLEDMQGFFTAMNRLFNTVTRVGKSGLGRAVKAIASITGP